MLQEVKSCSLRDTEYIKRVMEVEEERKRGGKDAPSLKMSPWKMSPSEVKNLLGEKRNMGLIFGAESIYFQDTVQAMHVEEMYSAMSAVTGCSSNGVNVLGVHMGWLSSGSRKAMRALLVDETGLVKDVSFEEPLELHVVQILHLPKERERELHRRISVALEKEGIEILNPYASSSRADDKNLTHEFWLRYRGETMLDFPMHCLIPSSYGMKRVVSRVKCFLRKLKSERGSVASIVVQPNKGTEGDKVKSFSMNLDDIQSAEETHPLVTYVTKFIHPEDDAILREERGNVKFSRKDSAGFRNITLRINTLWNGKNFVAESGYAQVSPSESEFVASRTQGGEIVPLSEALMNMYYYREKKWVRCFSMQQEIDEMRRAAAGALEALNCGLSEGDYLKSAGVDMVLEVWPALSIAQSITRRVGLSRGSSREKPHAYALLPVLLEINPRPAGLALSYPIPDM